MVSVNKVMELRRLKNCYVNECNTIFYKNLFIKGNVMSHKVITVCVYILTMYNYGNIYVW